MWWGRSRPPAFKERSGKMAAESAGRIRVKESGMVLQVTSNEMGERVHQSDWKGDPYQLWQIQEVGGSGSYRIVNEQSGLVLEVANWGTQREAAVTQHGWHGEANQLWQIQEVGGSGYYRIMGKGSGLALDIRDWGKKRGDPAQLWDWHGGDNQLFAVEQVGSTGPGPTGDQGSFVVE